MGYVSYLYYEKINNIKFYVIDIKMNHEKLEFYTNVSEIYEYFLYVLQEYRILCQEKILTHITYPPYNLYGKIRKTLKGVSRNT